MTPLSPFDLAIGLTAIGFIAYHFIAESRKLNLSDSEALGIQKIFFKRWTGVVCLGLIPGSIILGFTDFTLTTLGLGFENLTSSIAWILGLSTIAVLVNSLNAKKKDNLAMYPEVRAKEWTRELVYKSAFTWTAYLFAYEFLFRGVLWFCTVPIIGVIPAIILNCAFYALVHVPKGKKETLGAIPLGIILCILTHQTGTLWIAFVVHVALALSNEWFSLKHHPDMHIKN